MKVEGVFVDLVGVLIFFDRDGVVAEESIKLGITSNDLVSLLGRYFDAANGGNVNGLAETIEAARVKKKISVTGLSKVLSRLRKTAKVNWNGIHQLQEIRKSASITLVSNFTPGLNSYLDELGILDEFDFIVGSGDVGFVKPGREIFRIAMEGSKLEPKSVIFVDDQLINCQAARRCGIRSFHYKGPNTWQDCIAHMNSRRKKIVPVRL